MCLTNPVTQLTSALGWLLLLVIVVFVVVTNCHIALTVSSSATRRCRKQQVANASLPLTSLPCACARSKHSSLFLSFPWSIQRRAQPRSAGGQGEDSSDMEIRKATHSSLVIGASKITELQDTAVVKANDVDDHVSIYSTPPLECLQP